MSIPTSVSSSATPAESSVSVTLVTSIISVPSLGPIATCKPAAASLSPSSSLTQIHLLRLYLAPASTDSTPGSTIITTETYTLSIGAAGTPVTGTITLTKLCPGAEDCSAVVAPLPTATTPLISAPDALVSTFVLTTTITSGYSPQVVETSTYTVIETLSSEVSRSLSTASFTLTLETTLPESAGTPTSTAATVTSIMVSSYEPEVPSPAVTPSTTHGSLTVFTITLPGGLGSTPEVITVTATPPPGLSPTAPPPSIVTLTTTVSSGGTEVSLTPPSPVVSDVTMTYVVTDADGLALTTMTMATLFTYTPPAGVGTSYSTVDTVTDLSTVTVVASTPGSCPFIGHLTYCS